MQGAMDYVYKLRSTVAHAASQAVNALPGNNVMREYEVGEQVASAGPGLVWKVYAGKKHSTGQKVSVWVLDKKEMEKWRKDEREELLESARRGVAQLTRLRHPRLLVMERALEESRDSLAFCTEPVFASLANCLGKRDNLPASAQANLDEFKFDEIELRHGLFQLAEALAFLHVDARLLHHNICPEAVIVNERGAWKLSGFEFCVPATINPSTSEPSWQLKAFDQHLSSLTQPSPDFLAPECHSPSAPVSTPNADLYALGALAFAVFNNGRPPTTTLKKKNGVLELGDRIPAELRVDLQQCLHQMPELRPDATQFSKIVYFDSPLIKICTYLESLMQMDNTQKMAFFKSLPQLLARFEKRALFQKVLPFLTAEFSTRDLIPFILPSIFHITEQSSKKEFGEVVLPHLIPVFSVDRPYQIVLLLLQRMELLLAKADDEDVKKHILPLVYNAITNDTVRIQELCLSIVPKIGRLVDRDSMKSQLLPKLIRLTQEAQVLSVRVQALVCLGRLVPQLEPWMVCEQLLPALPRIPSKEPAVLMAILGIYRLAFDSDRLNVSKDIWARQALPFLSATLVESTLTLPQFEQYAALVRAVLEKVEKEQRTRLQQLSAGQEGQRALPNFDELLAGTATLGFSADGTTLSLNAAANAPVPEAAKELEQLFGSTAKPQAKQQITATAQKNSPSSGGLSLEEKKRIAAAAASGNQKVDLNSLLAVKTTPPAPTSQANQHMYSSSGLMSLSPMATATSTATASRSSPSLGMVDISDFLPSASTSSAGFSGFPAPSGGGSSNTPSATGFDGLLLQQPPRSTNSAVQKRPGTSNAGSDPFSGLVSFPKPPGQQPTRSQQSQQKTSHNNDPFADLLG